MRFILPTSKHFSLFILKFYFDTLEIRFMLHACRAQNPLYVWFPWSILVGNRKLIYLMIVLHSCRKQKPLICLSSMFHTCRTQETLLCLSFPMFVGHKIPVICLCSMFHTFRTRKPFICLCFRFHTFRIPKPLTCISKDLIESRYYVRSCNLKNRLLAPQVRLYAFIITALNGRISRNFILKNFMKICLWTQNSLKIWQNMGSSTWRAFMFYCCQAT